MSLPYSFLNRGENGLLTLLSLQILRHSHNVVVLVHGGGHLYFILKLRTLLINHLVLVLHLFYEFLALL